MGWTPATPCTSHSACAADIINFDFAKICLDNQRNLIKQNCPELKPVFWDLAEDLCMILTLLHRQNQNKLYDVMNHIVKLRNVRLWLDLDWRWQTSGFSRTLSEDGDKCPALAGLRLMATNVPLWPDFVWCPFSNVSQGADIRARKRASRGDNTLLRGVVFALP